MLFSCSKDDDNNSSEEPLLFLSNHVGSWETTFNDLGINVAVKITETNTKSFSKLISDGCYIKADDISSGTTYVDVHTAREYTAITENINTSDVFQGEDLDLLNSMGISKIDIEASYQSSSSSFISFAEIIYESGTFNEIISFSGNLGRINKIIECN